MGGRKIIYRESVHNLPFICTLPHCCKAGSNTFPSVVLKLHTLWCPCFSQFPPRINKLVKDQLQCQTFKLTYNG